jgi:predicted small lipoprotein YifL
MTARRQSRILAALLGALALAGCGQMGPLVLRDAADDQGEAGADAAAGNATVSGSGGEAEDDNESGGENER